VRVADTLVDLSATEFAIIERLARAPGRVFTRSQIIDSVRGRDYPVTDRSVDVQILAIRKKLGQKSDIIETVRGVGYRFRDE
jgi:two-component system phosphate regulon response regulator PhoB